MGLRLQRMRVPHSHSPFLTLSTLAKQATSSSSSSIKRSVCVEFVLPIFWASVVMTIDQHLLRFVVHNVQRTRTSEWKLASTKVIAVMSKEGCNLMREYARCIIGPAAVRGNPNLVVLQVLLNGDLRHSSVFGSETTESLGSDLGNKS